MAWPCSRVGYCGKRDKTIKILGTNKGNRDIYMS